jgi:hypothetical protein
MLLHVHLIGNNITSIQMKGDKNARRHGDPNGDPIPIFDLTKVVLQQKKSRNHKTLSQNKWQPKDNQSLSINIITTDTELQHIATPVNKTCVP